MSQTDRRACTPPAKPFYHRAQQGNSSVQNASALQFLEKEAERSGHKEFSHVLKTALVIAGSEDDVFDLKLKDFLSSSEIGEDTHLAVDFPFRFLLSDGDIQQEVLKRIEHIENGSARPGQQSETVVSRP